MKISGILGSTKDWMGVNLQRGALITHVFLSAVHFSYTCLSAFRMSPCITPSEDRVYYSDMVLCEIGTS